ncbi:MAG: hypothetical protein HOP07_03065 [Bacteriovoracaceae bacterium]|nr:hypothetical protein [Bacteriovoracaceae bacterium]
MIQSFRIDGIYDKRTLKLLKEKGVRDFCFDFSPKSFSFVQEHVFLSDLLPLVDEKDQIFFYFARSDDPMIKKLYSDIGILSKKAILECAEWPIDPLELGHKYLLNYSESFDTKLIDSNDFQGIIIEYEVLEKQYKSGKLRTFLLDIHHKIPEHIKGTKKIILKANFGENIQSSLIDSIGFELLSFSINSKIEICYRNVDLKKLSIEIDLQQNLLNSF